jgi:peptidoglycan/xylan/chitin deacetylase (PgdA/CDA1 family)
MIGALQNLVRSTDAALARAYLALFHERDALMCFLFHSLFRDEREIDLNLVDPLQRTTVRQFRQFVEYYLNHGYKFVSPQEVIGGLAPRGKYALITFDDGYFNNSLARPVLEEFEVPAVFFISSNHVRQNKCFWWDVLYRERRARGMSHGRIYREAVSMKSLRTEVIEERLTHEFGSAAFKPRGDLDRPFAPHELRDFASSPFVHIGSHTYNHAILTNYTTEEIREQLADAQSALLEMTGKAPVAIAYPNGAHDERVVNACRDAGLKLGFTVRPHKNRLPVGAGSSSLLKLGRFATHGSGPIVSQCRTYRSDLALYGRFRAGYLRIRRRQVAQ